MPQPRHTTALAALVGVPLLVVGLAACSSDRDAAVGDVLDANAYIHGTTITFREPGESVEVTVGSPADHVDADRVRGQSGSDEVYRAPDGAVFVPVEVHAHTDLSTVGVGQVHTGGLAARDVTVGLSVGDREVALGSVTGAVVPGVDDIGPSADSSTDTSTDTSTDQVEDASLDRFAVVPEESASAPLEVTVTYDGLTQRARVSDQQIESGAAAPLYDDTAPGSPASAACLDYAVRSSPGAPTALCSAEGVFRLAYAEGLGWARAGSEWAVVLFQDVYPSSVGAVPVDLEGLFRLDDRRAVRGDGELEPVGDNYRTAAVFALPDDDHAPHRFHFALHGHLLDSGSGASTYRASATLPVS